MERREFVTALGAAAAAISVSRAYAEEAPVKHMHPPKYKALMEKSAGKCVATGNECLRHCFGMLSMNGSEHRRIAPRRRTISVAACGALETLAAVNSTFTPALAKTVADVCMACKKECDKFPQYVECTDCGTACKACADECRKTMG